MAASNEIQEWSEASIRATILSEIQSGQAYTVLSEVIERIANETFKAFEAQASQITVQQRQIESTRAETKDDIDKANAEITQAKDGIQKTYNELQALSASMKSEAEANHNKLQDIVQHINDVPGKIKELQDMMNKVDAQGKDVQGWSEQREGKFKEFATERETAFDIHVAQIRSGLDQVNTEVQSRLNRMEYMGGQDGGSRGKGSGDRNVFDPRDYKLHDLGDTPTLAASRKWRHDTELFVETLGPSWAGVSSLLKTAGWWIPSSIIVV